MISSRVGRAFFARYTPIVARDLLGCKLVRVMGARRIEGVVVETEAYRGSRDPASHAFKGETPRNSVMFGEAGHAYVYFVYGFHYCLNVTTEKKGTAGAVLIRGVEPTGGVDLMREHRGQVDERSLASGPGKLTQAFSIDKGLDGEDMTTSALLFFERGHGPGPSQIVAGPRVGVSRGADRRWRFHVKGNAYVSGRT